MCLRQDKSCSNLDNIFFSNLLFFNVYIIKNFMIINILTKMSKLTPTELSPCQAPLEVAWLLRKKNPRDRD